MSKAKKYLLIFASLFLLGNVVSYGLMNDSLPPIKYQGDASAVVITVPDPNQVCGPAEKGYVILACEFEKKKTPIIVMPNPCRFPEAQNENSYAHLFCHEFGHVNGWNATHDN
jgi:hypothetical protein